jgi:hypothetical protein
MDKAQIRTPQFRRTKNFIKMPEIQRKVPEEFGVDSFFDKNQLYCTTRLYDYVGTGNHGVNPIMPNSLGNNSCSGAKSFTVSSQIQVFKVVVSNKMKKVSAIKVNL